MSDAMFEFERLPGEGFVFRFNPPRPSLLAPEPRSHLRAARKEVLLALRSLIDVAIEGLEKEDKPKGQGRTKIPVE